MEVLNSPNITRAAAKHPRKKRRKRSNGTSKNKKQKGQAKKRQRTNGTSEIRKDQNMISNETDIIVSTLEPSLISSACNAEVAKKEAKENHEENLQKVADCPLSCNPLDNDGSMVCEERIELSTARSLDGSPVDKQMSSDFYLPVITEREISKIVDATLEQYQTTDIENSECDEFDEDYFVDIANGIFETLPTPQKSLLLEEVDSDEEMDDDEFMKRLLKALDDDDLLDIPDFDKDYFLEVSNEIYETMSTSQKSLLLGEDSVCSEELIDDPDIAEQLLEAIDDDGWLKIHTFDKDYFLEVANEIYKTLSTPQKLSLLGGTISTEQDYNDTDITEMILAPIDDQDFIAEASPSSSISSITTARTPLGFRTPPPLDPVSSFDDLDLDTSIVNSSGSDLSFY